MNFPLRSLLVAVVAEAFRNAVTSMLIKVDGPPGFLRDKIAIHLFGESLQIRACVGASIAKSAVAATTEGGAGARLHAEIAFPPESPRD